MASLKSDIVGRVNRLPLRPTEKNALLPLMEAISNSIDSITERMGDRASSDGRVVVRVVRDLAAEGEPVIGFDVEDNGIGFTSANYSSFLTPDSRKKEKAGGKGVGRLAWLKVFKSVTVDSIYLDEGDLYRRKFGFRLTENDQIEDMVTGEESLTEPKTTISFRHFDTLYFNRCPHKQGTIANRILSHFVPLFVSGNAPHIVVQDAETIDIETVFSDSIVEQITDKVQIELDGDVHEIEVWSLKCKKSVKPDTSGFNFAYLTANNRAALEYNMDEQLGLKALEGEFIYVGCAYGEYLDKHVNAERTGFTIDPVDIDQIKRAIAACARAFLKTYIDEVLEKKVSVAKEVIAENPQFLYAHPDIKEFAKSLQPNAVKKEDIFIELSRRRFRNQRHFRQLDKEISTAGVIDQAIEAKIAEYQTHVSQETKGALAEYVLRRKSVLDLFEKFLGQNDDGEYQKEDAIHSLICPMRADSSTVTIEDHNLWVLDDRLAFCNFFASDLEISKYTGVDDDQRPDLAFFYDTCAAWRDSENSDTVIIVEFKRPMREDYSKGKDPVQQVLHYVKQLQTERGMLDSKGRAIRGINAGTAFHCYIVVDITQQLEDRIIGRYEKTPDGQGYFGYSTNPSAYVEIVPYGKVLNDARLRNAIFFKKLGITNAV